MSRLRARAEKKREEAQKVEQEEFWLELCRRINGGQLIPIISNAFYNDQIFDMDSDQIIGISNNEENLQGWNIEEQLADAWAAEIGYPLPETHWLPRVALYDRVVNCHDDLGAKQRYLNWLKDSLLYLAQDDKDIDQDTIDDLRDDLEKLSFADIAVELGYPKPIKGQDDPLKILAKLKLPIYVTTSCFDFLERAIIADNRTPRTQICFWSGEPTKFIDESHKIDQKFEPTPEQPLVYHINGLEAYPQSMVLSEADYLDFLTKISQDASQERPLLPWYLRKALTQSSLLLLGYRLRDWDFQTLFRGIINSTPPSLRQFSLAIQLDPKVRKEIISADQMREYLEKYFSFSNFTVVWGTSQEFIETLWEAWKRWR